MSEIKNYHYYYYYGQKASRMISVELLTSVPNCHQLHKIPFVRGVEVGWIHARASFFALVLFVHSFICHYSLLYYIKLTWIVGVALTYFTSYGTVS